MKQKDQKIRDRGKKWLSAGLLSFMLLFGALEASAQERYAISGVVSDLNGPLSGVTVSVQGTATGLITNEKGEYTIQAAADQSLEFRFVGYTSVIIPVGTRTTINVVLEEDTFRMDDLVVIGYGTIKKKDLTGSVQSIRGDEITLTPTNNVMAALAGKISGMDIMKTSGAIGEDVEILLRGTRSINGSNEPLFIIDGIPGSYDQVNPNDIETIDVLKDASATAIYGSAGANGVVIITTKRAKAGKAKVNFDAYVGVAGNASFWHAMGKDEYVDYLMEYKRTKDGVYPESIEEAVGANIYEKYYQTNQYVDWVGEAMKNSGRAIQEKYNLSVSGGSERVRAYGSLNYFKEEGMLPNEDRTRFGGQFNLEFDVRDWVTLGMYTNATYTVQNSQGRNIFTKALSADPWGEAYDEYGNLNKMYGEGTSTPLGNLIKDQFADERRTTYLKSTIFLDFKILKGLTYRTLLSGSSSAYRRGYVVGSLATQSPDNTWGTPFVNIFNTYNYGYTFENIVSYTFEKNGHNVYATGVTSWTKSQSDANNGRGEYQPLDYYLFYNIGEGTRTDARSSYSQTQTMSYALRGNYSYKGKYLASATVRWDGASHLAEGHKWDWFPAGAVAWRISDENFMATTKRWLSDLKLRASYGVTGNSGGMGAYSSQTGAKTYKQVSADGTTVQHAQMLSPYANTEIGWEKSKTIDIGLDVSLLKSRINVTFDWYHTKTEDILYERRLPATSALMAWGSPLTMWQNIGNTENKGFEIMVESRNISKKDFVWTTTLNVTHNKEKITSLPDGDYYDGKLFIGHPIKTHYDYKYAGIWSTAEAEEAAKYGAEPGYVKVETNEKFDSNGVGDGGVHAYTTDDRMKLGSLVPDAIIGLNNNFKYKNWELSIFMMTRFGQMIESKLLGWYTAGDGVQPTGVDYWLPETNEGAFYPRPGIANTNGIASLRYIDGSFFKIKNITLAYTLPDKFLKKIGFDRARFYVTGYDPVIVPFKKTLKGSDPENNGSDTFPTYKTYVFGVNLTF